MVFIARFIAILAGAVFAKQGHLAHACIATFEQREGVQHNMILHFISVLFIVRVNIVLTQYIIALRTSMHTIRLYVYIYFVYHDGHLLERVGDI